MSTDPAGDEQQLNNKREIKLTVAELVILLNQRTARGYNYGVHALYRRLAVQVSIPALSEARMQALACDRSLPEVVTYCSHCTQLTTLDRVICVKCHYR